MDGGDRLSRKRVPVLFNRAGLLVFISRMAGNIKGQESPHVSNTRHTSVLKIHVRVAGMDSARVLGRRLISHALRTTPNRVNTPACTAPAIIDAKSRRYNFGDRLRIERFRRLGNGTRTGETLTRSVGRRTDRPAATVAQRSPQLNARGVDVVRLWLLRVDGW